MTDSLKQARTLVTDVVAILRSRALFAELRNSPRRAALAAFSKETRKLSPRVEKAIVRQENESEILIGWSQLAVVALFGLFYLVAPKTFDPNMSFAPVPWALSLYFAATVIRIVWATGWPSGQLVRGRGSRRRRHRRPRSPGRSRTRRWPVAPR